MKDNSDKIIDTTNNVVGAIDKGLTLMIWVKRITFLGGLITILVLLGRAYTTLKTDIKGAPQEMINSLDSASTVVGNTIDTISTNISNKIEYLSSKKCGEDVDSAQSTMTKIGKNLYKFFD